MKGLSPRDKSLVSSSGNGWFVRLTTGLMITLFFAIIVGVLFENKPEKVGIEMPTF